MTENEKVLNPEETVQEAHEEVKADDAHHFKKKDHGRKELEEKIALLEEDNKKLKNDYYKAFADTENLRKRLQVDFEVSKKYRAQSFAFDILPVIDNLERALSQSASEADSALVKGIEMTYRQLIDALKKEGVEEIIAEDQPFDPNFHQALMSEKIDGVEANQVVQVLQKGYKIKDRILRASLVKISE